MGRILITSTELMMLQFLLPHVASLRSEGNEVELACSEVGNRFQELSDYFHGEIKIYKIHLHRSPARPDNLQGFMQLRKIIRQGQYDMIWTNEPVMGVMTRLAARKERKRGVKILYVAHGFHFCKGTPWKNWLMYFPIEWIMSNFTDILVTINQEDYRRAQKFKAGKVYYIPGIGINTRKFSLNRCNREDKREELGLHRSDIVMLSVGELSKRKNHEIVIEALAQIKNDKEFKDIHYLICGTGPLEGRLKKRIIEFGLEGHVHLLGFRRDISEICNASDIFLFPSRQEGLPVALMESMACGLPVICSNIRGNIDLIENQESGLVVDNTVLAFRTAIRKMISDSNLRNRLAVNAKEKIRKYDIENIDGMMRDIYSDCIINDAK